MFLTSSNNNRLRTYKFMFQTILQFIILPIASGALGGWVFFKLFGKKISPEVKWGKVLLWVLVSEAVFVIFYFPVFSFTFTSLEGSFPLKSMALNFLFAFTICLIPYALSLILGFLIGLLIYKIILRKKASYTALFYGGIIGGSASYLIAGNYWGVTGFLGTGYLIFVIFPLATLYFIISGFTVGAIVCNLLFNKTK